MRSSRRRADRLLLVALRSGALVTAGLVVLVVAFVALEARPALSAIGPARFLTDGAWDPAPRAGGGRFGLLPMLVGSLLVTAGAMVIAGPLGLLVAAFLRVCAGPRLARAQRAVLAVLAGVPSVVLGLWGLLAVAPLVRRIAPPGPSLLTGALVLALMIVPTVALLADAALGRIAREQWQGAASLGLSRWTTIRRVAWPHARAGWVVALLLGTTRALGETMIVLMACGNVARLPDGPFAPVRTLTAHVALELGYAAGDHRAALFASGALLLAVVLVLVLLAHRLAHGARRA